MQANHFKAAYNDYVKDSEINPERGNHFKKGFTIGMFDDHQAAQIEFEEALEEEPDNLSIIGNLATAYANNHHYDLAIQTAEKGITLNPKCIYCNSAKGFAYYETGKYAEAVTAYSKAIDFSIQQKHEKTYTKFSSRCEAYIGLKDFEKAFADCNRAIQRNLGHFYKVEKVDWKGKT